MPVRSEIPADRRGTGFTEVVDQHTGAIRAGGHLTEQGADLLRGAVLVLQGRGHDRVTLDLGGVQAVDDAGLRALRNLQAAVTEDGRELVLVDAPEDAGIRTGSARW
ncbi:STAS domain-containing protein [Modestobacter lapidis]|nr:STAS domain-containing protein [Modestobacter lapidis]